MDNRQVQHPLVFSNGGRYTRQFSKEENAAFADFQKAVQLSGTMEFYFLHRSVCAICQVIFVLESDLL
jgi:hypothetical protein